MPPLFLPFCVFRSSVIFINKFACQMTLFMVFLYERHISLGQMELLGPRLRVCVSHVVDIFVKICLQAEISNWEMLPAILLHICFSFCICICDFACLPVKVDKRNEFVIEFLDMFSKSTKADAASHIQFE